MKSILRGHIISYEAAEKRKSKATLTEIDSQLSNLEALYRVDNQPEVLKKLSIKI